jgi:hypothetical protein
MPHVVLAILLLGGFPIRLLAQPAGGLFASRPSFNLTNHLVSVSVFQWFSSNGGQLSGPWRPVEGRPNWTGTTNFWRSDIQFFCSTCASSSLWFRLARTAGPR